MVQIQGASGASYATFEEHSAGHRRPSYVSGSVAARVLFVAALALMAVCIAVGSMGGSGGSGAVELRQAARGGFVGKMPIAKNPARTQALWFGPGISDQLNRYVRIGQGMSERLKDNIAKGLDEQSKMVHLDDDHQGEVGKAADESDLWTDEGGNNNGGNEPCMDEPGKCP